MTSSDASGSEMQPDGGQTAQSTDVERSLHEQYEPEAPIHKAVNITSRALKGRCEVEVHDEYELYRGVDPETGVANELWQDSRERAIESVAHDVQMDTCHVNECLAYLGEDADRIYCDDHRPEDYIECAEDGCTYPTAHTETNFCSTHTWYNGRSSARDTDQSGEGQR